MINHRVQKYIEDHSFCSEYLFRDWEAFLDFIYEEGCRVSSILWWEHCKKNFQHGYGGYSDPDDREWMYSETGLHEDGFVVVATLAVKNAVKLFDARYHMFLRATDSVFVTLGDMGATASAVSQATPQGTVHRAAGHRQAERLSGRPERTG